MERDSESGADFAGSHSSGLQDISSLKHCGSNMMRRHSFTRRLVRRWRRSDDAICGNKLTSRSTDMTMMRSRSASNTNGLAAITLVHLTLSPAPRS